MIGSRIRMSLVMVRFAAQTQGAPVTFAPIVHSEICAACVRILQDGPSAATQAPLVT